MGPLRGRVSLFTVAMALGGSKVRSRLPGCRRSWGGSCSIFLSHGGLASQASQLVEPINQTSEQDSIVPGLCAFLLGVCYEYNREPGEITR